MKKLKLKLMIILLLILSVTSVSAINDLELITENYPPYNFEEDGKAVGIAPDLMGEMLKLIDTNLTQDDIKVLPWSRGYNLTQKKPNTVLFSTTRTKQREDLFKWVGPIVAGKHVLMAKKDDDLMINSFSEVSNYSIGGVLNDISVQLLKENDVPNSAIETVTNPIFNIKKIEVDRIDAIAYGEITLKWLMKTNGFDVSNYEVVFNLENEPAQMYYAFYKDTPNYIIEEFQSALDKLKEEPSGGGKSDYQKILDRYLK